MITDATDFGAGRRSSLGMQADDSITTAMSSISPSSISALAFPAHHSLPADSPSVAEARWARRLIAAASVFYFGLAGLRYAYFHAGVADLGCFDQAIYLISRGKPPFIPVLGTPILAQHGAYILYPLALLYIIYPSVLWLFATQAIAMAGSAWFVWRLARLEGITPRWTLAICSAWLVYPVVVLPNLHDFHPEVLAVPAILGAVLYARDRRPLAFSLCLLVALGTKDVIALTVAAMGLWLFLTERNRVYGLVALVVSAVWFVTVTRFIIPLLAPDHHFGGYHSLGYLGQTSAEAMHTIFFHPLVPLRFVFCSASAIYLAVLLVPVWWGLRPHHLIPLLGALPCVTINLLSDHAILRNPFFHYSMAVAPFVFLAVISALAADRSWLTRPWMVGAWITLTFLGSGLLLTRQVIAQQHPDQPDRAALQAMVDQVGEAGGVLSTHQLAAHLMHREMAFYLRNPADQSTVRLPPASAFDWVLLDFHDETLQNSGAFGREVLRKYQGDPKFIQLQAMNGLYLFHRIAK